MTDILYARTPEQLFQATDERQLSEVGATRLPDLTPLPTDKVGLNADTIARNIHRFPPGQNSRSEYSALVAESCITTAKLKGQGRVERWLAESLAVLMELDPAALIVEAAQRQTERGSRDMTRLYGWSPKDDSTLIAKSYLGLEEVSRILMRKQGTVKGRAQQLNAHRAPADRISFKRRLAPGQPNLTPRPKKRAKGTHAPHTRPTTGTRLPDMKLITDAKAETEQQEVWTLRHELIDTRLHLLTATLEHPASCLPASVRCSVEDNIERIRELVTEVKA